jgi:hypothetical protein
MQTDNPATIRMFGFLGLLASVLVGVGEFTIQYAPEGGYEMPGYQYFNNIPEWRLTMGHYLGVLAAPLYIMGYFHICLCLSPANKRAAMLLSVMAAYAFIIGTVWLGGRVDLALTVQAINANRADSMLLQSIANYNEPLINVLRIAMLVASVIWVWLILTGRSMYPRWMAIFSPILLLAVMFLSYTIIPSVGHYLLPIAMNAAHFVLFSLSLLTFGRDNYEENKTKN